jgi:[pyruvate, water dikinase]-phosphate phosphotransferase / [pyruvate, water dikinase] kinase
VTPARETVELHIVSDSTGETAARLVAALEAQFPEQPFEEVRHPRVETLDDLQLTVSRAKGRPAVMVYTLVDREMRELMRTLCRSARLHYCDLLGHPIESIAKVSGMAARMTPGARPPLNSAYFKRMEAIEFAVKFDDGVGNGLREADIVLVGVSRTSKTPTSIYLANRGVKTGNVPLVPGVPLPPQLEKLHNPLVVGLFASAERIVQIRQNRLLGLKAHREDDQYIDRQAVAEEVAFSRRLYARHNWASIDVTRRSIEETAAAVIKLLSDRRRVPAA